MALDNLRAVLYGRVSADRRKESRSVDSQLDLGQRWARREGVAVVGTYRDDGISASPFANGKRRADWELVVAHINNHDVDLLWLWELSRGSRDREVFTALFSACQRAKVRIVLDERILDPNDPDDAYQLDTGAATAVFESAKTSKRVRRAVMDRATLGRPHGNITYGYRSEYDPHTGKLLGRGIDPATGPVVQNMVERVLAGESVFTVCRELNDAGVPAPHGGRWLGTNASKMICNPAYVARRMWNGRDVGPATWPPLITEAQHYQLKAIYSDPSRDRYRQDTRVKYLGVGIYRCGPCDAPVRSRQDVRRSLGVRTAYQCRECRKVQRIQPPLDVFVEELVVRRLSQPDLVTELAQGDDSEQKAAADEVLRLKGKLKAAKEAWNADQLSLEAYMDMEAMTLPKITTAEQRAKPRHIPSVVYDTAGPDARAKWGALGLVECRAIVEALVVVKILPLPGQWDWSPNSITVKPRLV